VSVQIRRVVTRRDLRAFVELPRGVHRNHPLWVPPLKFDVRRRLDRNRNPFFEHAEAEYFLAMRDGRPVGRISAHVDHNLNAFQDNEWGLFGWFDAYDDPEATRALLDTAEGWLRERDRERMVGPMSFTTNDPCGVLVDGFERLPVVLNQWDPPYYGRLLGGAGLTKAMDACMWTLHVAERDKVHPAIFQVAAEVESKHGITCRYMRKKDLQAEVERFLEVYNEAWARNWGFVPLTENEVKAYVSELRPVLDEHWAMVAEKDGQTVGAALSLPDYNQVLVQLDGRLLPLGWLKALRARRHIDAVRVFALGVKRAHRHTGVAAKFYEMHFDSAAATPQKRGETGWILESNRSMNKAMEGMGGEVVSRYRFYEKVLRGEE